jgi:superfamily II DNA or RNA helicase
MIFEQRPYQTEFIEAVLTSPLRRILGVLPTGTGKTICFSEIARRLNRKTLILAHREELIEQACTKVAQVWEGVDIGVVKAERHEIEKQVMVASIQSLYRDRLETLPPVGLLITDEAHHATAPSYRRVYHRFGVLEDSPDSEDPLTPISENTIHLGVTATPKRSDNQGLGKIFTHIVYERKMMDFVPEYLSDLRVRGVNASLDFSDVRVSRLTRDFDEEQLGEMMRDTEVTRDIFRAYSEFASDRTRTLVFCVNRAHAWDLYTHFSENGVRSGYLDYETPSEHRKAILNDFRTGKIAVLFNVLVLTEGFDLPEIDCILIARPTKSPLLLTQMIGRGTRKAAGKADCMIIDVAQWQRGRNAVSVASLFDLDPSQLTEDKLVSALVREGTVRQEVSERTSGEGYAPEYEVELVLDTILNIPTTFSPDKHWHFDPPTVKQIAFLQSQLAAVGENLPENLTKGIASAMISAIFDQQPATEPQKNYLRFLGVAFDEDISKHEAARLIGIAKWRAEQGATRQ